jgi:hypothetical protein
MARPSRAIGQRADRYAPLKRLLEATFTDPAGIRKIGRQYLATGPEATADAFELAERLLAQRPADIRDLRQILARFRYDCMRQRSFVLVDGWILPRLEAQVCALTALL